VRKYFRAAGNDRAAIVNTVECQNRSHLQGNPNLSLLLQAALHILKISGFNDWHSMNTCAGFFILFIA